MKNPFEEYDHMVTLTRIGHDDHESLPLYAALGLGGEAGEVLELVKKAMRPGKKLDRAQVLLELGDVLWYVARVAQKCGFTLEDVATVNTMKLMNRKESGKDDAGDLQMVTDYLHVLPAERCNKIFKVEAIGYTYQNVCGLPVGHGGCCNS